MTKNIHEFTVRSELRDSPTMSEGPKARAAWEKLGKNGIELTLGDLFPKPTQTEIDGWMASLVADAKKANPADPKYSLLRDEKKLYAYSTTDAMESFRITAAECFTRDTGIAVGKEYVAAGCGGKGALNGGLSKFKAGDVVFVGAPGWPTNYDMFPAGVKLVEIATKDGLLRADDVVAALAKYPNPAGILINAPCNPTGANYTRAEREAFFAAVAQHTTSTTVLSDNPYGKLVFDQEPYDIRSVLQRGPAERALFDQGRLACFQTVSKEYGLAGERVGWMVTKDKEMLSSCKRWNEKVGGIGKRNQLLAQAALIYGDSFIERTVGELTEKRKLLVDGIGALQYAEMKTPQATIYGWVDFAPLKGLSVLASVSETGEAYTIDSPAAMKRYLINVAGICGVPGAPFYAPDSASAADEWHMRISFCCETEQLKSALHQLAEAEGKLVNSHAKSLLERGGGE